MIGEADSVLTDKQRAVLERIDRRLPIKLIASEMGVSETRINQHIRALKGIYGASSLNELVEQFRKIEPLDTADLAETRGSPPFRKPVYSKKQMSAFSFPGHEFDRGDPGSIRVSDAHVVARDALWAHDIEPVVVFGALNGKHAVFYRLAAIIGLGFGMIAAVVLLIVAALSLSEVLDGKASIPVENTRTAS